MLLFSSSKGIHSVGIELGATVVLEFLCPDIMTVSKLLGLSSLPISDETVLITGRPGKKGLVFLSRHYSNFHFKCQSVIIDDPNLHFNYTFPVSF